MKVAEHQIFAAQDTGLAIDVCRSSTALVMEAEFRSEGELRRAAAQAWLVDQGCSESTAASLLDDAAPGKGWQAYVVPKADPPVLVVGFDIRDLR